MPSGIGIKMPAGIRPRHSSAGKNQRIGSKNWLYICEFCARLFARLFAIWRAEKFRPAARHKKRPQTPFFWILVALIAFSEHFTGGAFFLLPAALFLFFAICPEWPAVRVLQPHRLAYYGKQRTPDDLSILTSNQVIRLVSSPVVE